MKVLLHVNYVEGPGDCLERLFALAARVGCDGVELRWKYRYDDRTQEDFRRCEVCHENSPTSGIQGRKDGGVSSDIGRLGEYSE